MTIYFYEAEVGATPAEWTLLSSTDIVPMCGNFTWGAVTLYCTDVVAGCNPTYSSNPRAYCQISAGSTVSCTFCGLSNFLNIYRYIGNGTGTTGYVYQNCQCTASTTASGGTTSCVYRCACFMIDNCHNTTDSVFQYTIASIYHCNFNLNSYANFGFYIRYCDGTLVDYPGVALGAAACAGTVNVTRNNILFCIDYVNSCICYCDSATSYQCPLPSCHICHFGYCIFNCARGYNNWGNSCSYTIIGVEAWNINCGKDPYFCYCRAGNLTTAVALPAPMCCAAIFLKNNYTAVRGISTLIDTFNFVNENGACAVTPFIPTTMANFTCICNTSSVLEQYCVASCLACCWGWALSSETCLNATCGCLNLASSYTGAASCLDYNNSYIYLWRS